MDSRSNTRKGCKSVALHCPEDDSHVVVAIDAVIYEDSLEIGDEVNFAYPGMKRLQTGTVKGIDEDYNAMVALCVKLNKTTKPKREPSFDESKPRKAALRCKENGFGVVPKTRNSSDKQKGAGKRDSSAQGRGSKAKLVMKEEGRNSELEARQPVNHSMTIALKSKDFIHNSEDAGSNSDGSSSSLLPVPPRKKGKIDIFEEDEDDGNGCNFDDENLGLNATDDRNDSDSSSESLTEEERRLLDKIAKKKKLQDYANILKNAESSSHASTTPAVVKGDSTDDSRPKMNMGQNSQSDEKSIKKSQPSFKILPGSTPKVSGSGKAQPRNKKSKSFTSDKYTIITFEGETLQILPDDVMSKEDEKKNKVWVLKSNENVKVEKLISDYDVYVKDKDLKSLRIKCSTASALTRGLMRIVFTDEARRVCSVSGKPSFTKGQEKPEVRPALNQEGIAAIIEYVQARSEKKTWKVPEDSTCKQFMGNLLCEEHAAARLQNEAEMSEQEVDSPDLDSSKVNSEEP